MQLHVIIRGFSNNTLAYNAVIQSLNVTSLTNNVNVTQMAWIYPTTISFNYVTDNTTNIISFRLNYLVDAISSDPYINKNAIGWDYDQSRTKEYVKLIVHLPNIGNGTVNTTQSDFVTFMNKSMVVFERQNVNAGTGFTVQVTFPMVISNCAYTGYPLSLGGILGLVLGLPSAILVLAVIMYGSMYFVNTWHDMKRKMTTDQMSLIN